MSDVTGAAVQSLKDALGDEWPDTFAGRVTYAEKYELAADIVDVLLNNDHVRRYLLHALVLSSGGEVNE